jgi:hypothetical protein
MNDATTVWDDEESGTRWHLHGFGRHGDCWLDSPAGERVGMVSCEGDYWLGWPIRTLPGEPMFARRRTRDEAIRAVLFYTFDSRRGGGGGSGKPIRVPRSMNR